MKKSLVILALGLATTMVFGTVGIGASAMKENNLIKRNEPLWMKSFPNHFADNWISAYQNIMGLYAKCNLIQDWSQGENDFEREDFLKEGKQKIFEQNCILYDEDKNEIMDLVIEDLTSLGHIL